MDRGRPSKYKPEMLPKIIDLMKDGGSIVELAPVLGITRETIYDWCRPESPSYNQDFSDTMKKGIALAQAWWEKQGREGLWGGAKFNATAFIFQMKNKFPADWKDKQEITVDAKVQAQVKIETLEDARAVIAACTEEKI